MNHNFVAGKWVPAAGGGTFERRNPADRDDLVGEFPASGGDDAVAAVKALESGRRAWAAANPERRMQVLEKAADIVLQRIETLAPELTREEGKPLGAARMEWQRTAANFRLYAGEAVRTRGETFPAPSADLVCTVHEPVGIVLAITPWNFPVSIPSRKIGPALATGNGVLFKPSEISPLTGQRLVEILLEAGLPEGAISLLQGPGKDIGEPLITAPAVKAITFTGSYATGCVIHRQAGPDKRLQLEMGGKNPCIILADADPERAAKIAAQGAFNLTGQACTASSRVIVVGDTYDDVVDRIVGIARGHHVGNGLEAGVTMGPLASAAQFEKVREMIEIGLAEGLEMAAGDERPDAALSSKGWFVRPTVFVDVPNDSRLSQEEIFGPVVCLSKASSYEEALAQANSVDYGLAASIVTSDMARAFAFARDVEAGVIKVNSTTGGVALSAPFGGLKHSSNQTYKEQAGHGVMDFYTRTKTVYFSA